MGEPGILPSYGERLSLSYKIELAREVSKNEALRADLEAVVAALDVARKEICSDCKEGNAFHVDTDGVDRKGLYHDSYTGVNRYHTLKKCRAWFVLEALARPNVVKLLEKK